MQEGEIVSWSSHLLHCIPAAIPTAGSDGRIFVIPFNTANKCQTQLAETSLDQSNTKQQAVLWPTDSQFSVNSDRAGGDFSEPIKWRPAQVNIFSFNTVEFAADKDPSGPIKRSKRAENSSGQT